MSGENKQNEADNWLNRCSTLVDGNGAPLVCTSVQQLSTDQLSRYLDSRHRMGLESLEMLTEPSVTALLVRCNGATDHIVVIRDSEASLVLVDDAISYEQLSPLQLVEYAFNQSICVTI